MGSKNQEIVGAQFPFLPRIFVLPPKIPLPAGAVIKIFRDVTVAIKMNAFGFGDFENMGIHLENFKGRLFGCCQRFYQFLYGWIIGLAFEQLLYVDACTVEVACVGQCNGEV